MPPIPAVPRLLHLDERKCRSLLQAASFGRLAVTQRALPTIVPVVFAVLDDTVVAVCPAGSPALAAREGAIVTLEIDSYNPATAEGWSVTVIGPATIVSDWADIDALDSLGIAPWVSSHRHYIKIVMSRVTGRELVQRASTSTNVVCAYRP